MKEWKDILIVLAKKLTPILAFAILVIVAVAVWGKNIPSVFQALIYIVVIGGMLIYTAILLIERWPRRAETAEAKLPKSDEMKPAEIPVKPMDAITAREKYLQAVIADCRAMRLVGLDPQAADPSRGGLTLESLYISLDTTTSVQEEDKGKKKKKGDDEEITQKALLRGERTRLLSALEAISNNKDRKMVLLGQPGTGKSTFARYLALRMAQAEGDRSKNIQDLLPGWQGGVLLPVIVSLGRMAETVPSDCKKGQAALVEKYIAAMLESDERTSEFAPLLLPSIERSGGLLLFDGLDEVADLHLRPIIVQAVEDFVEKYAGNPASRFMVTCRTYSYLHDSRWQLTGWPTHELALLDEEKINYFVNAWHAEHARIEPSRSADYEHKREALLASLQPDDRRRLHEIAPFPIILTMMAVVHTHYGELPDTRAQVYEKCVDLLLVRWELERPVAGQSAHHIQKRTIVDALGIPRVTLDRALWEIAFKAHEGRKEGGDGKRGQALVTEELLSGVLQAHLQDLQKVQLFLDYCQSSNGLLMLQGTVAVPDAAPDTPPQRVYAFPHLTFEEYLAARSLVVRPSFGKATRELVNQGDRWREVVILLGEHLCFAVGDQERMDTLLGCLSPELAPADRGQADWRALWLAGDLLTLYRRAFPSQTAPAQVRTIKGLHCLVEAGALETRARAAAADTLDELGWLPGDLYDFLPVGEGGEAFHLAKYPVTNLQYERFLKSGEFAEKTFWLDFPKFDERCQKMDETWGDAGWDWLQRMRKGEEEKVIYPRAWNNPRFGIARKTAPVGYVTWWEANAYCKWLLKHWAELEEGRKNPGLQPKKLHLPTETEWVLAAGGEAAEGRYPWDEKGKVTQDVEEILRRANVAESRINHTTPVGMYPLGASSSGVVDMAGNVWEWQANFYNKNHDFLALRGGSWHYDHDFARVADRYYSPPENNWSYIGFRVALPPI